MEENTRESGRLTIWKGMECIYGMMEENTKESIKMIKNMGMASTSGLMEDNTLDIGLKENSMDWEFIK